MTQIKNGSILEKGYCNSSEDSAIVKIQKMLQDKGLLDSKSYNGYYGDKTQDAVKSLWKPSEVKGTEIGKKTLEKLEGTETKEPEKDVDTTTKKVSDSEALKLFY
jgi:hypothetical protein